MQTKQGWMNQKISLDLQSGISVKPLSLDILRKISEREFFDKGILFNQNCEEAFKFTELYVWEKYLLKEWKELGLWEKYKPIQFDSVDEFFYYDNNIGMWKLDSLKLYDIMKFFVNGSYKSEDILDSDSKLSTVSISSSPTR